MGKTIWLKLVGFIALILGIVLLGFFGKTFFKFEQLEPFIRAQGIWAPLIYIGIYMVAVVFLVPGSGITLLGGFLFGLWPGLLFSMIAALAGATIAFLIARFIAQDWIRQKIAGRLAHIMEGIEAEGWKFVALMRLVPIIPFNLLNYALGLTRISLLGYVVASGLFMIPGCFAYTLVGSLGPEAISGEMKTLVTKALFAFGVLILLSLLPWIVKKLKRDK